MDEEEQFVNIDLNDDNICSVCKLETETGTLSFCHVCFELSIEGKAVGCLRVHQQSAMGGKRKELPAFFKKTFLSVTFS